MLYIIWQPEEEGVADQFVEKQSKGELNYTLHEDKI